MIISTRSKKFSIISISCTSYSLIKNKINWKLQRCRKAYLFKLWNCFFDFICYRIVDINYCTNSNCKIMWRYRREVYWIDWSWVFIDDRILEYDQKRNQIKDDQKMKYATLNDFQYLCSAVTRVGSLGSFLIGIFFALLLSFVISMFTYKKKQFFIFLNNDFYFDLHLNLYLLFHLNFKY